MSRGISPSVWGAAGWDMLHHFAARACDAPERMKTIIDSLVVVLPCPVCRDNLRSHMEVLPYPRGERGAHDVPRWLYRLHVRVNKAAGAYAAGEKPPLWRDIKTKYCPGGEGGGGPSWDSVWVFLESAVATFDGRAGVGDGARVEKLWKDFWDGVLFFMGREGDTVPAGALKSRAAMSAWLARLKKKVGAGAGTGVGAEGVVVTKCNPTRACSAAL